jgi:hypothetical protein
MSEERTSAPADHPAVGTRPVELFVGLGLFAFGGLVILDSLRLGRGWATDGPEAGFYPFYVGIVLCAASSAIVARNLRKGSGPPFVSKLEARRVASVLVPSLVYGAGLFWLGLYVASALFLLGFIRYLGKSSWLRSLALAVAITACLFALFELWLEVPLPKGALEAWLGF